MFFNKNGAIYMIIFFKTYGVENQIIQNYSYRPE